MVVEVGVVKTLEIESFYILHCILIVIFSFGKDNSSLPHYTIIIQWVKYLGLFIYQDLSVRGEVNTEISKVEITAQFYLLCNCDNCTKISFKQFEN